MKITFVCANWTHFSGGNRVIALYAQKLQQRGHDLFVVCPSPRKPSLIDQMRSLKNGKGWITSSRPNSTYFDHTNIPRKILNHQAPLTDADVPDADVVIATWWETAYWVANLSPQKGAKAYFMQDYGAPGQELEKIVPTWSLPLHLITIAEWLVTLIHKHCGSIPVSLVPNSVDLELFNAPPRKKQTEPTVGFVYRHLSRTKGVDLALKAVEIARQRIPNLRLIIYGGDENLDASNFPPLTEYHYQVPDQQLHQLYSRCDAWLFPSRLEGFGLPILEAMACRTPVIGMPTGAAPELLADGCGILVQPEDPVDMAQAIETIVKMSESQWQQMSDAAYAKATSYTWDNATDRFEGALYKAIERSNFG